MKNIKLNLGCANDIKQGYINIDKFHEDEDVVVMDVRDISAFSGENVTEIYASDVLEHLPFDDATKALGHWIDILSVSGKIYIKTICITSQIDALISGIWDLKMFNAKLFAGVGWVDGVTRDHDYHKSCFSPEYIRNFLKSKNLKIEKEKIDQPNPQSKANLNMEFWAIKQ